MDKDCVSVLFQQEQHLLALTSSRYVVAFALQYQRQGSRSKLCSRFALRGLANVPQPARLAIPVSGLSSPTHPLRFCALSPPASPSLIALPRCSVKSTRWNRYVHARLSLLKTATHALLISLMSPVLMHQ